MTTAVRTGFRLGRTGHRFKRALPGQRDCFARSNRAGQGGCAGRTSELYEDDVKELRKDLRACFAKIPTSTPPNPHPCHRWNTTSSPESQVCFASAEQRSPPTPLFSSRSPHFLCPPPTANSGLHRRRLFTPTLRRRSLDFLRRYFFFAVLH